MSLQSFSDWFYGTEGSAIDQVPDVLNKKIDNAGNTIKGSNVYKQATNIANPIKQGAQNAYKGLKDAVNDKSNVGKSPLETAKGVGKSAVDEVKKIGNLDGFKGIFSGLGKDLSILVGAIVVAVVFYIILMFKKIIS